MERHVQSLLQALILAALLWVGKSLIDLQAASAATQSTVAEMKEQLRAMDARFQTYLPRSEAEVRFNAMEGKHTEYERRLNTLDSQVEQLRTR